MPSLNDKVLSPENKIQTQLYKNNQKLFYMQSKLFDSQITSLFDDLWVLVTSLKNLRWQVNGYYHLSNSESNANLVSKFVEADDKTNRPNLYRSCISRSWDEWDNSIAQIYLTNMFAFFEGWLEMLLDKFTNGTGSLKKMQFPDSFQNGLNSICQGGSTKIIDAFYDRYKSVNKHYNLSHLENYLKVYRYFKECRNCFIHQGGLSNQKLVDAYNAIKDFSNLDIDVKEMPLIEPITAPDIPVKLYLRGVVGFSQILLKIVSTYDIEFIKCGNNEALFLDTIKEYNMGKPAKCMNLNSTVKQKTDIVNKICSRAHYQCPIYSDDLYNMFKDLRFIV